MSTKFLKATLVATAIAGAAPALAKDTVVGLSPFGTPEAKFAEVKAVTTHLLQVLAPGETGWVVDAYNQVQISEITISTDPRKSATVQRRMRNAPVFFAEMKAFADGAQVPDGETFEGQIDFPGFVRTVGGNYPADGARDLILYGVSPLTHDPRMRAYSMKDGAVPDDASIAASRADNVYGAAGEEDLLANYTVHWGTNGAGWVQNDVHQFHVRRFLALSVAARGGLLATFATEPDAALRNAKAGLSRPVGAFELKPGDRPTMVTYTIGEAAAVHGGSIYARPLSDRVPGASELATARDVQIAIRWTCDCDFDLAVQPAGGPAISFRAPNSAQGTLQKDFTSSAALELGWETVTLPGPIDLAAATVAINNYRGPSGMEVELRIAVGGETWGRTYIVPGGSDGGRGFAETLRAKAPANPAWVVVDPRLLMGGV